MYEKKYYEVSPNVELVANQSHSFFYPVSVSVSNHFLQNYNYDISEEDEINIKDYIKELNKEIDRDVDIHNLLDYTMLFDESLINLQLLFSTIPNKEKYNIVQHLKSRGIHPNPEVLTSEEEV